jgi:KDO2-lipid IV(A) lauroyltransferase
MLVYLAFRLATFLVRHLPRRWGQAGVRWLGGVIYRVSPMAEAGRDNFRHVLGPDADPDQVAQLTQQAFQERLYNYYDLLRLSDEPMDQVDLRVMVQGLEVIDQLVEAKRGAIIATGHMGPLEFVTQTVASLGYDCLSIMEQLDNERLLAYIVELRSAHGLEMISTQGSLLDVYRRIKRGAFLMTAMDRDSTDTGLIVSFFGAPAWMPDGYARLAVRADVPLIFGHCTYTESGPSAKLYPPIYPDQSLGKEQAARQIIERTVALLEEAIRSDPGTWHLSTPVWRLAQERVQLGAPQ